MEDPTRKRTYLCVWLGLCAVQQTLTQHYKQLYFNKKYSCTLKNKNKKEEWARRHQTADSSRIPCTKWGTWAKKSIPGFYLYVGGGVGWISVYSQFGTMVKGVMRGEMIKLVWGILFIIYLFIYLVCLGPHLQHMEVPRLEGLIQSCSCWPTPQPHQRRIRATSATSAGSLTHCGRPGIKPESSWILVSFVTTEPQRELQGWWILDFMPFHWPTYRKTWSLS